MARSASRWTKRAKNSSSPCSTTTPSWCSRNPPKVSRLRVVQGDHTGLADPHGMALDAKNGLLYMTNHGSTHQVRPPERGSRRREEIPGWPLTRDDAVP